MSELADKERRAIKILRMYRGNDPIEVSYSGGKDSDVILTLTKMAGIPYRAIYKNTTIDPPGTVQHCKDETDTYDEGFDPDVVSYHEIVLNIIKELKA